MQCIGGATHELATRRIVVWIDDRKRKQTWNVCESCYAYARRHLVIERDEPIPPAEMILSSETDGVRVITVYETVNKSIIACVSRGSEYLIFFLSDEHRASAVLAPLQHVDNDETAIAQSHCIAGHMWATFLQ